MPIGTNENVFNLRANFCHEAKFKSFHLFQENVFSFLSKMRIMEYNKPSIRSTYALVDLYSSQTGTAAAVVNSFSVLSSIKIINYYLKKMKR